MDLRTGKRVFLARPHSKQEDFQAFLKLIHQRYRGREIALLLDEHRSHTAARSRRLADDLRIRLLWLPHRAPDLNPMDELWGQAKDITSANLQYPTIEAHVTDFIAYLESRSNWEARHTAGTLSKHFWLKSVL